MTYQLTRGQWEAISPDYRREREGRRYFLAVNLETLDTDEVDVELVDEPVALPAPEHYGPLWPLDPRD